MVAPRVVEQSFRLPICRMNDYIFALQELLHRYKAHTRYIQRIKNGPVRPHTFQHHQPSRLVKSAEDSSVSGLRLVIRIKQQRGRRRSPRIRITNTPDSDANALSEVKTSLSDSNIVARRSTSDIQLRDSHLGHAGGGESAERGGDAGGLPSGQMCLRSDAGRKSRSQNYFF